MRRSKRLAFVLVVLLIRLAAVLPSAVQAAPGDEFWAGDDLFTGLSGRVSAIVRDNSGNLYVGGYFTTAWGVTVNHVARWNIGSKTWSALGSGVKCACPDRRDPCPDRIRRGSLRV